MKDLHDLYLFIYLHELYFDVLLLADVFEKLRNNSLKSYGLCPSRCLNAPGLS